MAGRRKALIRRETLLRSPAYVPLRARKGRSLVLLRREAARMQPLKGVSLLRYCSLAAICSSERGLLAVSQQWEASAVQLRALFRPIHRSRAFRSPKMPLPSWLISPKCPMAIIGGFQHLRTCPSAVLFGRTTTPSQPACARPKAHTRSIPSVSTISDRQTWQKS